jgi:uncharacterized protein YecE (DUF72 family)
MGSILIGISAWSDAGLSKAGFYPAGTESSSDKLRYYATRFDVAEVDSTYHFFATARIIDSYLGNSPAGFAFNLKAFSMFTGHPTPYQSLPRLFREKYGDSIKVKASVYAHHLPPEALEDLWQGFARTAAVFQSAGRLGAVLFQFPPWFHPSPDNYAYIAECRRKLPDHPLAVEFRVGSWLGEENRERTLETLKANRLSLVCVDEPQGLKTSVPPLPAVTAPLAIVRFHGRNAEKWEARDAAPDERFEYLYSEEELREWVPRIRDMASQTETLHVIFKNKHQDYPVKNALQMKALLEMP